MSKPGVPQVGERFIDNRGIIPINLKVRRRASNRQTVVIYFDAYSKKFEFSKYLHYWSFKRCIEDGRIVPE